MTAQEKSEQAKARRRATTLDKNVREFGKQMSQSSDRFMEIVREGKSCVDDFLDFPGWMKGKPVPPYADFRDEGFSRNALMEAIQGGPDGFKIIKDSMDIHMSMAAARFLYIDKFGYMLPCAEAVRALVKLSPLVEIGAGTGALAAILKVNGADVIATDLVVGTGRQYGFKHGEHMELEQMDAADAVAKYPDRAVLAVWPSLNDNWCTRALKKMKPGGIVALVSAGQGGCIGDDSLFEYLDRRFDEIDCLALPQWPLANDRLEIFRKKTPARKKAKS